MEVNYYQEAEAFVRRLFGREDHTVAFVKKMAKYVGIFVGGMVVGWMLRGKVNRAETTMIVVETLNVLNAARQV